jgi:hypothetical protein
MSARERVPTTKLSTRAYSSIFGAEVIDADEVIIDIGSGDSRLGSLVPDGEMIQVDPVYGDHDTADEAGGHGVTFVNLELGTRAIVKSSKFRALLVSEATRVTSANLLHHLKGERKCIAVEQILLLARYGIAQFHPVFARKRLDLPAAAEKLGVDLTINKVPVRSMGQLLYRTTPLNINRTLTVHEQPDRMTPRNRTRLAEIVLQALV